jgi:hypothetical protein
MKNLDRRILSASRDAVPVKPEAAACERHGLNLLFAVNDKLVAVVVLEGPDVLAAAMPAHATGCEAAIISTLVG